jgi:hypothetical protein
MSEDNKADNKIKGIIQALLAHAKGTQNEVEAASYLSKAMELMEKHQLELSDMVDAADPILHHVGLSYAESGHAWRWKLYDKVARLYGCKSIHVDVTGQHFRAEVKAWQEGHNEAAKKGGNAAWDYERTTPLPKRKAWYEQRLVGRQSSIVTTDLMYPYIADQVKKAGKAHAALTGMSEQGATKRVAAALISRILDMLVARDMEDRSAARERARVGLSLDDKHRAKALAIMDQVVAKYERLYPKTVMTGGRGNVSDSLAQKQAAGIGLHRQTSGAGQLQIK